MAMLSTVCRRVESPRHVDSLDRRFVVLLMTMYTGRPAPGALEIPIDIQYAPAQPIAISLPDNELFAPNEDQLSAVVKRLQASRKTVVVAGGGVISSGASSALLSLAEKLDLPVITTVDGRGCIPETHPLCVGNYYNSAGIYNAIQDAEVTLAIGTKFAVGVDGQFAVQKPPGDLIQIDIDGNMVGRTHRASIGVIAMQS